MYLLHIPPHYNHQDETSPAKIVEVIAGGIHNIAIDTDGTLYSWGCNDQRALGREGEEFLPGPIPLPAEIVIVACGDSLSAALDTLGRVWLWGTVRVLSYLQ